MFHLPPIVKTNKNVKNFYAELKALKPMPVPPSAFTHSSTSAFKPAAQISQINRNLQKLKR
jgi:hypothetical protein